MITNELMDYIKAQLAAGVSKETIIQNLSAGGGWNANNINEAFASLGSLPAEQGVHTAQGGGVENKFWTKRIPWSNKLTLYASLPLVFGLDLWILVQTPELFAFWAIMLAVLTGFFVFLNYENNNLSQKFQHSHSKLDYWILTMVGIRNLVVILNFIPLIQILGMGALLFAGIPYLIIYLILISARKQRLSAPTV